MNLLLNKFSDNDYLDYNNLFTFSKTLHQPLYQLLIKDLENGLTKQQILNCILTQNFTIEKSNENKSEIQVHCFEDGGEIPDSTEIDPKLKTIIIFNDMLLEKQNKVESYYARGRHNNVDRFKISQNYIKLLEICWPQTKTTMHSKLKAARKRRKPKESRRT
jgi:hypothetical protein